MHFPRRCRSIAVALVAACFASACGTSTTPSQPAFCRRVESNFDALRTIGATGQAARTLDAYRKVGAVAPIGVRDAWTTLTAVIESAATDDLTLPAAQARFAERILSSKPAFDSIIAYTRDNCGVDLTAPPPTTAAPTTTAPPATVPPATVPPAIVTETTPATAPETESTDAAATTIGDAAATTVAEAAASAGTTASTPESASTTTATATATETTTTAPTEQAPTTTA